MKGSLILTDARSVVLYSSGDTVLRTGFDIPEIIGRRPGDLWGGLMPKAFYKRMWGEIRSGKGYSARVLNRHKNGSEIKDTLHIAPVLDERGEARYFLELHPDLSSADHMRRFEKEFADTIQPAASPERLTRFLEKWFAPDFPLHTDSRRRFLEDLHAQLVKPNEERFLDRFEDRGLVREAQADPETFHALYRKYHSHIHRFFRFRLSDGDLAEDMTQEVFLRAFRALASYAPSNASYLTYLLRVSHNLLVSHYRGVQDKNQRLEDAAGASWMEGFVRRDAIERALVHVTNIERDIVMKKYREGLSIREIAVELNRSENAVKLHLSRARKKMKSAMEEEKGVE